MGDILYQPEPRKTMNGINNSAELCRNNNSDRRDAIDLRKEPAEYERRRKIVEEAKKLIFKAQKV